LVDYLRALPLRFRLLARSLTHTFDHDNQSPSHQVPPTLVVFKTGVRPDFALSKLLNICWVRLIGFQARNTSTRKITQPLHITLSFSITCTSTLYLSEAFGFLNEPANESQRTLTKRLFLATLPINRQAAVSARLKFDLHDTYTYKTLRVEPSICSYRLLSGGLSTI
jgi:hypothetical protein